MAFRNEEETAIKTYVICDGCKKESLLDISKSELGFDRKMNGALSRGYTFKTYGGNEFKNYCKECEKLLI